MGEVIKTFLIKRIAQRYVEIKKLKGVQEAMKWWQAFKYTPSTPQELEEIRKEITKLDNSGGGNRSA